MRRMRNRSDLPGLGPGHASLRPGNTKEAALEMEHLTHVDAVSDELGACCLDVIDDEERSLN